MGETILLAWPSHHITTHWKFLGSKADDGPGSVSFAIWLSQALLARTPHASRSETDYEVTYEDYRRKFARESSRVRHAWERQ